MPKIRNRYRLSKLGLDAVRDNRFMLKVALLLDVTETTIRRYIKANSVRLTIPDVVELIHEETGLGHDQILERVSEQSVLEC